MADYILGASVPVLIDPPLDIDGNRIPNPTIQVSFLLPNATTAGPFTPTYDATDDQYVYIYTPASTGQFSWLATVAGAEQGAVGGRFYVYAAFALPEDAWKPVLTDVAALVPTRTIDSTGAQLGTFTAGTTPTATQVTAYIAQIVGEIVGTVGEVPSEAFAQAKGVASLGVAWLVERSYPPTADVQNVANDLVTDYRASLRLLEQSVRNASRSGSRAVSMSLGSFSWPEV